MSHNLDRPIARLKSIISEREAEGLDVSEYKYELICLYNEKNGASNSNYISECFPELYFGIEYKVIYALISQGFYDDSYGGDTCPSFRKDLSPDKYVKIYVDAALEVNRESNGRRFSIHLCIDDEVAFHWSKASIDAAIDICIGLHC